jgi:uncharacterized protein
MLDDKTNITMKNIFFALTILISTTVFGQNGEKNFIDQNYLEVTGKAEMEIVPDEIYLKIIVNEKDFKNKSLGEIESSMIAKLQEIGIDPKKEIAIKDIASNFKYYLLLKTDILLVKEYQVLVHDGKTAGKVIVELQKLGISNARIDRIDNSKLTEYRKEVKINAIKAAQEKAKSLALAINQDIGRAIYIQELDNNIYNSLQGKMAGIQIRGTNSITSSSNLLEPDIEFEKISLDYSILVRFELK